VILAAGLTPAWQQILCFDRLEVGEVNRAREAAWCASGKVLNVAMALKSLGESARVVAPLGGQGGAAIEREFAASTIESFWVQTQAPTRICTSILEDGEGRVTELVENAAPLSHEELNAFAASFSRASSGTDAVVFTGSLPSGTPIAFVRDLIKSLDIPVVLDIRGPELLSALECRPTVVKPNRDELWATLGAGERTEVALLDGMRLLRSRGAQWVVVSHGPDAVWASGPQVEYRFIVPRVAAVNPIGSGDCLAAGIAAALARQEDPLEAIRSGIASAVDNVRHLLPARLDPVAVTALVPLVEYNRL
jgi:1-phosphofructokinase family hexose kinase